MRFPRLSFLAVMATISALTGSPAPAQPTAPSPAGAFNYRDTTLDNGLRVITLEDFSCPVVAVHLWYHVGSKDENPERQGFAHMFEHMMFQGTDRLNNTGHFDNIHRVGGDCNAYTAFDQTVYVQTLPANQLDLALYLEAERMAFLRVDQRSFDTERKVVEEERRLGLNRPYGTVIEQVLPQLFKKHPYRWSPIGKIPHLRSAAVQELRDFWGRYYVPNNATLVIVGAVKHEDAQKQAKNSFGWIPRVADPARVTIKEPIPEKARSITIQEPNAPVPIVGIAFRGVPNGHKDEYALQILASTLGGGQSSRLYRELVAETQQAAFAAGISFSLEQDGILGFGAVLPPLGGDSKKVMKAVDSQIARVRAEGITEEELTKGKNQLLRNAVTQTLTVSSKATMLGQAAVLDGDLSRVNRQFDEIRAVTLEDLQRVATTYLAPERALKIAVERNLWGMLLGGKNKEEDALITAKPEEAAPPPGRAGVRRPETWGAAPPIAGLLPFRATPQYKSATLDNGLKVIAVGNSEVPYVTVQLGLQAGSWAETKPGVANMALSLLTKGTEKKSEAELARELDTYAISLGGSAGTDSSSVTASCVTDQIERAVALLSEVVLTPTFPPKEFSKLRRQVRTGLALSTNEPAYIADRELRQRLYGEHPYSRTVTGEPNDVAALKASDIPPWWNTFARPDMATLIFAGDIDLDRAVALAKKGLGSWKAEGNKPEVTLAPIPARDGTQIYIVDRPGSVQSQIRAGQIGLTRRDPRFATASVVGGYFGGAFGSRLNETIRVKKGLTYGAGGGFRPQRFAGQFTVNTFSKTASTGAALEAVFQELDRLGSEPPSSEELDKTRSHYLGGFVGDRETPQQAAGDIWMLETNGLDDSFFDRMITGVTGTTADACTALIHEVVDPGKMVVVVVGDAGQIKQDLEKLGPVTVIAPETKKPGAKETEETPADEKDVDDKKEPAPAATKK